mgnify:CR=1 FL=1
MEIRKKIIQQRFTQTQTMSQTRVVLIDNYDSFTWNIYEYLCQEGAEVLVYRNDKITLQEIENLKPDILLISPGPGHPITDSGVSCEAIKYFIGKIPIFGVCMGEECMIQTFGGEIKYAGEIIHGKTSAVTHDGKGVFENVPQGVLATRYHSLAADLQTLPECFEVTATTTDSNVIMGIRHKKYTVEGVQFHPESILTEEGHLMIRNILNMKGFTTWEELHKQKKLTGTTINAKGPSILDTIYAKRKEDYAELSKIPGKTFEDLQSLYDHGLAPSCKNLYTTLTSNEKPHSVLAEIKRASPSKGDIDISVNAIEQGLKYAQAGASAISILTEPKWFKGSLQDLINVRKYLDLQMEQENRPCVLRKEFIFNKYQILESRLAGADTVLLIVKMLDQKLLKELYDYSRELDMEPLVEVSSKEELDRALEIQAKVIGVNNRDLHSFNVDMNTTTNLVAHIPSGTVLVALSGILKPADAETFKSNGVQGFLVGEGLMRSKNVKEFINELCN